MGDERDALPLLDGFNCNDYKDAEVHSGSDKTSASLRNGSRDDHADDDRAALAGCEEEDGAQERQAEPTIAGNNKRWSHPHRATHNNGPEANFGAWSGPDEAAAASSCEGWPTSGNNTTVGAGQPRFRLQYYLPSAFNESLNYALKSFRQSLTIASGGPGRLGATSGWGQPEAGPAPVGGGAKLRRLACQGGREVAASWGHNAAGCRQMDCCRQDSGRQLANGWTAGSGFQMDSSGANNNWPKSDQRQTGGLQTSSRQKWTASKPSLGAGAGAGRQRLIDQAKRPPGGAGAAASCKHNGTQPTETSPRDEGPARWEEAAAELAVGGRPRAIGFAKSVTKSLASAISSRLKRASQAHPSRVGLRLSCNNNNNNSNNNNNNLIQLASDGPNGQEEERGQTEQGRDGDGDCLRQSQVGSRTREFNWRNATKAKRQRDTSSGPGKTKRGQQFSIRGCRFVASASNLEQQLVDHDDHLDSWLALQGDVRETSELKSDINNNYYYLRHSCKQTAELIEQRDDSKHVANNTGCSTNNMIQQQATTKTPTRASNPTAAPRDTKSFQRPRPSSGSNRVAPLALGSSLSGGLVMLTLAIALVALLSSPPANVWALQRGDHQLQPHLQQQQPPPFSRSHQPLGPVGIDDSRPAHQQQLAPLQPRLLASQQQQVAPPSPPVASNNGVQSSPSGATNSNSGSPQPAAGSLVANINCNKIRGHITMTPNMQGGATISTQITAGPLGEVYQWSIHQFPVKPGAAACTCSPLVLGSKLIDLSEMHGNLPSDPQEFSVQSTLQLFGFESPVGHSLLVRGLKTGMLACATFLPTSRKSNYRAKFHSPISGSVTIFQTAFGTSFISHLMYSNGTRRHSVHRFDLLKSDDDLINNPLLLNPLSGASGSISQQQRQLDQNQLNALEQREHDNELTACRRFSNGEPLFKNLTYQLAISTENFGMRGRTSIVLPQIPFETFSSVYVIIYSEYDPNEPIACAPLRFIKPKTAAAKFQAVSVQGSVVFSQESPYDVTVARVNLNFPNSDGHSYGIDELPMIIRRKTDTRVCPNIREIIYNPHHVEPSSVPPEGEATSDQYAVGDLSGKYGSLTGKSSEKIQMDDYNLPLFGPVSIIGRALTIYSAEGVAIACSNVELTTQMTTAFATFDYGIQGQFIFRQPTNDCNGDTYVYIEVSKPGGSGGSGSNQQLSSSGNLDHQHRSLDHNWHIHVNPVDSGLDHLSTTECAAAGTHYNPYNTSTTSIYSRDCTPFNVLRCELGDLSAKMFTIEIPPYRVKGQEPDIGKFFGTDIDLPLCGPVSIVNRSVVVHVPDFGSARLACSTVIEFRPRN